MLCTFAASGQAVDTFKLCRTRASDTLTNCLELCRMFVILPDDMRNTRDTNQAVNRNLSIFLCSPFLELTMQRFGPLLFFCFFCFLFLFCFVSSYFLFFSIFSLFFSNPSHVRLAHFLQNKMVAFRLRHNLNFSSPQRV